MAKILTSLRAGEIVLFKDSGWGKTEMGDSLSVQDLMDPRARAAVAKMALELAKKEISSANHQRSTPTPIVSHLPLSSRSFGAPV